MRAAIDSLPLSESIFRSYDYTSLQVNLLTSRPLSCYMSSGMGAGSEDGKSIKIRMPDDQFWSDGKPITPDDYRSGIELSLNQNPFIRAFLLRHLRCMCVKEGFLEIELSQINYRLSEILQIPNFCPYRNSAPPDLSSGDWILTNKKPAKIQFHPHPHNAQQNETLAVHLIKDPADNLELFSRNEIDITADTAFPYSKIRDYANTPQLHSHSVGLYCALTFGKELGNPEHINTRRLISSICANISFDSITFGQCPKVSQYLSEPPNSIGTDFPQKAYHLAYDDFYPNKEICNLIKSVLAEHGIQVILVRDNYYNPSVRYDFKLSILRSLNNSDYCLYASHLLCEALKQNIVEQRNYLKLLLEMEAQPIVDPRKIKTFILEQALLCPLFEIKSIYLSKKVKNPLVEGLVKL